MKKTLMLFVCVMMVSMSISGCAKKSASEKFSDDMNKTRDQVADDVSKARDQVKKDLDKLVR